MAQSVLETNNWNLEAAISFFLDHPDTNPSKPEPNSALFTQTPYSEPEVRAPIRPSREQLALPDAPIVEVPKTAFQIRGKMSRELWKHSQRDKGDKTLSDLFAPPFPILFEGSFEDLKKTAVQRHKLAMVNVQNVGEFACQRLNRDVLRLPWFQDVIKDSFVFQQLYVDDPAGQRVLRYYELEASVLPVILFLDPLTGEKLDEVIGFQDADALVVRSKLFYTDKAVLDLQRPSTGHQDAEPAREAFISSAVEDEHLQAALALSMEGYTEIEDTSRCRKKLDHDADLSPPKRAKLLKPRTGPCIIQGPT